MAANSFPRKMYIVGKLGIATNIPTPRIKETHHGAAIKISNRFGSLLLPISDLSLLSIDSSLAFVTCEGKLFCIEWREYRE
jgi:hypothetical protein